MSEADRLSKGEGKGDATRVLLALMGSKAVSSPSSSPDMRRFVRGLRVEAVEWVELFRTLLLVMADYVAAAPCRWDALDAWILRHDLTQSRQHVSCDLHV